MSETKKLVDKKEKRTFFLTPLEIYNYMSILGAAVIGQERFMLNGKIFSVDRENKGIYCSYGIPKYVLDIFKKYGMEDSIYGPIIFD